MFRDDQQVAAAARVLLRSVRLERLWNERPTGEAFTLLEQRGGPMSSGESLMLFVAFDLWNGHGKAELGRMLGVLDNANLRLIGSLLVAFSSGPAAVDRWVAKYERGEPCAQP